MIFSTSRAIVRELDDSDAAFLVELLNDPAFLEHIGDRGVRDVEAARLYLERGPRASYREHGFGLWCVTLLTTNAPIGICGVLRRSELPAPDLGYAFLPSYRGQGLAREVAAGTVAFAREHLKIERLLAIVSPGNAPSIRLLESLGFLHLGAAPGASSPEGLCLFERNT